MVKADAYGIGLEPVVPRARRGRLQDLLRRHLSEGGRARGRAPEATIYVLNGLLPGTAAAYAEHRAAAGPRTRARSSTSGRLLPRSGARLPAALHVDTGMNRLGLRVEEALALQATRCSTRFEPALVMSHLVCADDAGRSAQRAPDRGLRRACARRFRGMPGLARQLRGHLPAASALTSTSSGPATRSMAATRRRAAEPDARRWCGSRRRILQVRDVEAGETVGYNGTLDGAAARAGSPRSRLGYADGYPRAASAPTPRQRGASRARRRRGVAAARSSAASRWISSSVDVTDVPAGAVRRGDLRRR